MNKIYIIASYFWDCDYHEDLELQYGYFLNKEDAKKVILEEGLQPYGSYREDEGYDIIEIEPHKTKEEKEKEIANYLMNIPRYKGK